MSTEYSEFSCLVVLLFVTHVKFAHCWLKQYPYEFLSHRKCYREYILAKRVSSNEHFSLSDEGNFETQSIEPMLCQVHGFTPSPNATHRLNEVSWTAAVLRSALLTRSGKPRTLKTAEQDEQNTVHLANLICLDPMATANEIIKAF